MSNHRVKIKQCKIRWNTSSVYIIFQDICANLLYYKVYYVGVYAWSWDFMTCYDKYKVFCGENQVRERRSALGSLLKTPTKDRDVVESKRSIQKSVRLLSTKTGWTCGTTSTCMFISQSWNLQMLWNDFRPCFGYQKSEHRLPKGCRCQYSRRLSKTIRA